jgi:hypothetical protein
VLQGRAEGRKVGPGLSVTIKGHDVGQMAGQGCQHPADEGDVIRRGRDPDHMGLLRILHASISTGICGPWGRWGPPGSSGRICHADAVTHVSGYSTESPRKVCCENQM